MKSKVTWSFKEESRNVHIFNINLAVVGDEQWFLLQSDVHWDNPKCDRKKLEALGFGRAKERANLGLRRLLLRYARKV